MPKPQAEWAGSIADVDNLTHLSFRSVSNGLNPGRGEQGQRRQSSAGHPVDLGAEHQVIPMPTYIIPLGVGSASAGGGPDGACVSSNLNSGLHNSSAQPQKCRSAIPKKIPKCQNDNVIFNGYSGEAAYLDPRSTNDQVHATHRPGPSYPHARSRYHNSSSRDSISQSAIGHKTAAEIMMGGDDPLMALAQVAQEDSARLQDTDNRQLAAAPSHLQAQICSQPQYSHAQDPNPLHRYQQFVHRQQQQPVPLSSATVSHQHMLAQGLAAAGPGLSLPKPQAEWAGSIADVVNHLLVPALTMRQKPAANHQTSLVSFGGSSDQYPGPSQQWRGAPLEGGGDAREKQARFAPGVVPGDASALLPNSASAEEMVNSIKVMIKKFVRQVCNDEYRQHHERDSASEAVKTHLKKVALHAQARLLKHLVRLQPGQSINDVPIETIWQSYNSINVELAYKCVFEASQALVPQFHWLTGTTAKRTTPASRLPTYVST